MIAISFGYVVKVEDKTFRHLKKRYRVVHVAEFERELWGGLTKSVTKFVIFHNINFQPGEPVLAIGHTMHNTPGYYACRDIRRQVKRDEIDLGGIISVPFQVSSP